MEVMSYSESRAKYAETLGSVIDDREEAAITPDRARPRRDGGLRRLRVAQGDRLSAPRSGERPATGHRDRATGVRRRRAARTRRASPVWDESSRDDHVWWRAEDRKILNRVNALVRDVMRNGDEGIGEPEPPQHGPRGLWLRRTSGEHRLVHTIAGDETRIAACRYHYGK